MTLHKFIRCKLKSVFLKTGKGHEQHESGDTVDDISNLPDCILHQILSFIPTKEVVKMSILSTRWKNLWASAPNIDFNDGLLYAKTVDGRCRPEVSSFINFVDRVLALRDPSNMEKFHLSCFVCNNASKIHSWISYAIMHNVQELDLCLFGVDPFVIPRCMLDSTPLVSLKIKMDCVIELPSHVSFPFLKTLHLSLVRFPDDASTEKLFSGCPFLEELVLLDCYLVNLNNIVISSSTLKSLTIHDLPYFGEFDDTSGCNIKIDAVNLTYFKYFGNLLNDILLNNALSLIDACIHIPIPQERETEVTYRAIDLLKQLRYVVSLRISNRIMEGFGHHMCLGENDPILIVVPICMLSCLKIVTFKNFHANDSEIYFLKCILKYACVLERMDIVWSKTRLPDLKKQAQARTELETIQRSSTACHVKFS
uniref:F-box domain-containing protein n=1 Tax=Lactuca sativa TaxID=4236 RepID=A0A9R1X0F3_LACSA|nr:hypothetical protein LSAT_V11C700384890 [Lactuca sativa]